MLCRLAWPPRSSHGRETTGPSSSNARGILPQSHSRPTSQIWQITIDASFSTIGQSKDDWRSVLPRSPWQCSYRANALRYVQIKLSRNNSEYVKLYPTKLMVLFFFLIKRQLSLARRWSIECTWGFINTSPIFERPPDLSWPISNCDSFEVLPKA